MINHNVRVYPSKIKLDKDINLVNCNNHAIDIKINNISKKPFNSSLKI